MEGICFGPVRLTSSPSRLGSERKSHMSENLGARALWTKVWQRVQTSATGVLLEGWLKAISLALWNVELQ